MIGTEKFSIDVDTVLQKYSDTVYKVALSQTRNKYDADDVFQEVFLRLLKHIDDFLSEEHVKQWLIRVTINCSRKHFRYWSSKSIEISEFYEKATLDNEEAMVDKEEATLDEYIVYKAVLELPSKYRTVIHLFYYEQLTTKQISEILKIKENTVKSQLRRGREMIRETLKGEINDEY